MRSMTEHQRLYEVGVDVSSWPVMKIARAQGHVFDLRSRIAAWSASQPVTVTGEIAPDRRSAAWRIKVTTMPPTTEWALCVGDCIHQLRSALDACIWEFAIQNGIPDGARRIQFPISTDAEKWEATAADRLRGVADDIVERVRIVQPFNRPEEERPNDALLLLQAASNADKHQASVRANAVLHRAGHNMQVRFANDAAAEHETPPNVTFYEASIEDGALLAELHTVEPIASADGAWSFDLRLVLETDNGPQLLVETLDKLVQYVNTVLGLIYGGFQAPEPDPHPGVEWENFEPTIAKVSDETHDPSDPTSTDD